MLFPLREKPKLQIYENKMPKKISKLKEDKINFDTAKR
jgi:hypothetical protein